MFRVLMIAYETGRWGASRLPENFAEAGFEIALLSPADNPVAASSFVNKFYDLPPMQAWRRFAAKLQSTMQDWKPDLIIPCDEPVVAMLHHILKKAEKGRLALDAGSLKILQRSIGNVKMLDAMLMKHDTRLLAESLHVPVPASVHVTSAEHARKVAEEVGTPVYLKKSFSWGGLGSIACENVADVEASYQKLFDKKPLWKKILRHLMGRNWYPVESAIDLQKAAPGTSSMYNVVAWQGEVLGGFFGIHEQSSVPNGPSTIVRLGHHEACAEHARKMIKAYGATGFYSFDFMVCAETGATALLECNPRPNQVNHLGKEIGVDMCGLLAEALAGTKCQEAIAAKTKSFPLFPQEWFRDEQNALNRIDALDVPVKDSGLLAFFLREGQKRGRSAAKLCAARHLTPTAF